MPEHKIKCPNCGAFNHPDMTDCCNCRYVKPKQKYSKNDLKRAFNAGFDYANAKSTSVPNWDMWYHNNKI